MKRLATVCVFLVAALATAAAANDAPRPTAEIAAMIGRSEPGATVRVPPGLYHGRLRVDRPVVLDGGGKATIDGLGEGTVVEILAEGVIFRGFTVRGSATNVDREPAGIRAEAARAVIEHNRIEDALFGIDLRMSPGSAVRDNTVIGRDLDPGRRGDGIILWWSKDTVVERNTVSRSRDMVFWYSQNLTVRENTVTDSRYGLHFMYSHDTVLSGNTLSGNSVGIYLMYSNGITVEGNHVTNNRGTSGYGLGLKDCDDIVIRDNAVLANRVGFYVDNSPSSIGATGLFEGNLVAFNEIGLLATPNTHDNVVTANAFVENEEQASVHGRGTLGLNTFARDGVGNFWSDYAGYDRDGDGLGDLPYEPRSLFESLLAREPNLRFFVHSPAQQAVEFTARALPELRPEPKLVDPAPMTRPPAFRLASPSEKPARSPMIALAGGLLILPAACVSLMAPDLASRPSTRRANP